MKNSFTYKKKKRSASRRRKGQKKLSSFAKFLLSLMAVSAVVCIILFTNKSITNADESGNAVKLNKYYKTITINSGDTLWSIAREYKSGAYKSTQDYVDELMSMNNLHTDEITSGQNLVVAYFSED